MADNVHMVKQVIHYSDGSTKEVHFRGVIENGVLTPDKPEDAHFASEEAETAPVVLEEVAEEEVSEEASEE